jgi:ketosteroid isomerase-like protein
MEQSLDQSLSTAAQTWVQAMEHRDVDQIVSSFADDIIAMYPRAPTPTIGKTANHDAWTNYFRRHATHPLTTDQVIVATSNDIGYTLGRWASAETIEPNAVAGRYTAVWRRQDLHWQIVILSAHIHEDVAPFPFL